MGQDEFGIPEFAKYTNGRIEGLRLILTIFLLETQSKDQIETFVNSLSFVRDNIERRMKDGEFQFDSKWYPDGTLSLLNSMIEGLTDQSSENQQE